MRPVVLGAVFVAVLCLPAAASAQSVPTSSSAPGRSVPRTRPAPAAFLWIPLVLVAGSVYAVRVFVQPISRRNDERA